jgi:thiol-disulfide isomerase/thioredoxin
MQTISLRSLMLMMTLVVSVVTLPAVEFPLTGTTLAGDQLAIDPVKQGKPVLLVFWASWCGVCVREMPVLIKLQTQSGAKLDLVSLSIDTEAEKAKASAAKHQLNYVVIQDGKMIIADQFGVDVTPTMILLGKDGREIARGRSLGQLSQALDGLGIAHP